MVDSGFHQADRQAAGERRTNSATRLGDRRRPSEPAEHRAEHRPRRMMRMPVANRVALFVAGDSSDPAERQAEEDGGRGDGARIRVCVFVVTASRDATSIVQRGRRHESEQVLGDDLLALRWAARPAATGWPTVASQSRCSSRAPSAGEILGAEAEGRARRARGGGAASEARARLVVRERRVIGQLAVGRTSSTWRGRGPRARAASWWDVQRRHRRAHEEKLGRPDQCRRGLAESVRCGRRAREPSRSRPSNPASRQPSSTSPSATATSCIGSRPGPGPGRPR